MFDKTFKEYRQLSEDTFAINAPGNYVSVRADISDLDTSIVGEYATPEPHMTLMYSKKTNVDYDKIDSAMSHYPIVFFGFIDEVTTFEDSENGNKAIVFKIKSDLALEMHSALRAIGLHHSFNPFEPHVTVAYNVPPELADNMVDTLRAVTPEKHRIRFYGIKATNIVKNWSERQDPQVFSN
jgi:2'-5' RNA ligase